MNTSQEITMALRHMRLETNSLKSAGIQFKQSINRLQYVEKQKPFKEWLKDSLKLMWKKIKLKLNARNAVKAVTAFLIICFYAVSYNIPAFIIPNRDKIHVINKITNGE